MDRMLCILGRWGTVVSFIAALVSAYFVLAMLPGIGSDIPNPETGATFWFPSKRGGFYISLEAYIIFGVFAFSAISCSFLYNTYGLPRISLQKSTKDHE
jgi:hypothetical protein